MIPHFWFTLLDLEFLTTRHDNVAKILQTAIDTIGYLNSQTHYRLQSTQQATYTLKLTKESQCFKDSQSIS